MIILEIQLIVDFLAISNINSKSTKSLRVISLLACEDVESNRKILGADRPREPGLNDVEAEGLECLVERSVAPCPSGNEKVAESCREQLLSESSPEPSLGNDGHDEPHGGIFCDR